MSSTQRLSDRIKNWGDKEIALSPKTTKRVASTLIFLIVFGILSFVYLTGILRVGILLITVLLALAFKDHKNSEFDSAKFPIRIAAISSFALFLMTNAWVFAVLLAASIIALMYLRLRQGLKKPPTNTPKNT